MSAEILAFPVPEMSPDEAMKRIWQAGAKTALIGWCDHALEKLGDEISTRQVLTVFRDGDLKKGPTWNEEYQDWVCVLRKVTSGRSVHIVVGVYERRQDVTLITVY